VFTHQRRELVRSKDVLELHVQARTQQLQKLQRAYELILNSAGEGICGLDNEGKVTFVNPAAAKMMALSVSEMIGQHAQQIFPQFMDNGTAGVNNGPGLHPTELVATRRDGTSFGAEFLRTPICEGERVVGEVLLFKDITERKQAAETLAQKAVELARSNAELEQFAFVASHDLQEPLRKIQAFGDRLKMKCAAVNLEEGRDYLERMQNAAARMQTLIYDLLTFSRVISRTEPFVPVDLKTVAREVIGDLEVRIEKTKGAVEVGELPSIEADALQMRQLLLNLIGNALKFHAPGTTPLVRVQARLFVPAQAPGNSTSVAPKVEPGAEVQFCELTVTDNGIGFDEKYLDRIFAVFQRLHGRQEYEGTGIGLAVCRRIVDRHGGTITARSKPGEGATFIVTLPTRQAAKVKGIS
jgi:PAS domain S-box-containing protein